ncbi:uncharacterized protein L969DRAFT_51762 [Mixia osmundae IAM 14324]|uniref:Uncharacterized protein n=1 Tax=Mixia osmundae (strain CBS 9802 / IAM 14324 / JCM 22182 / KY 12970) TaxID=764103 RepID=G7EAB9_MIXOS|nr:uncharacterized protein L969DRAFT_51762 [Mixia osmundae IAM 14324]KEI37838.1 hypothetical protein L969DRAFT_51762 [Mixia osmundae IAM 14324]GAA99779.1 hypothetical protein E5Q_06482 [Mixia osmundae IAM 14324]
MSRFAACAICTSGHIIVRLQQDIQGQLKYAQASRRSSVPAADWISFTVFNALHRPLTEGQREGNEHDPSIAWHAEVPSHDCTHQ